MGLGRFGRSVAVELAATVSQSARFLVVERSAQSCERQLETLPLGVRSRVEVHIGDAASQEAIARITDFAPRAVIVCTDSDLGNLRLALDLRRRNVRTVTRMFDLEASRELARGLEDHGVATVGLARLFRAAIPILTHERRLQASINLDVSNTPDVDHLFYLARLDAGERSALGMACVGLEELAATADAPPPPEGLALVWHRAIKRLSVTPAATEAPTPGEPASASDARPAERLTL